MADELLDIQDRIRVMITIGESHFREFKSCFEGATDKKKPRPIKNVAKDIGETLVAFANADGGDLLIGVEDDGTISGIPFQEDDLKTLNDAPKTYVFQDTPLPLSHIRKITHDNKTILFFSIPPGTDYCYLTSDGRCLQRKDLESVPVSAEHIKATRQETISREYDRQFETRASIQDLDLDLISIVAGQISHGMTAEKCLQYLDLGEFSTHGLKLRRAALLLFAKNITKWHPRSQVRVLKIDGTQLKTGKEYNVSHDQETSQNILRLIDESWTLIRPHLVETRFSQDAKFQTQIIYPELACKEALINAIAHRDYSREGMGIEVNVFTDRLEIISPGGLLSSVSMDDLKKLTGVHQSRNSLVAKVLRELGYMRELGEGMRRIFKLLKDSDLTPPTLVSTTDRFSITLSQQLIYTEKEKLWLDNFNGFALSRAEKTVVRLGYDNHIISPQEIWDSCGIVDTENYRQIIENLYRLHILKRAKKHDDVIGEARFKKIPKKQISRYQVILPTVSKSAFVEKYDEPEYSKIFIGNIPPTATKDELLEFFQQYGAVSDIFIPVDFIQKRNKGFAFVEFEDRKSTEKVLLLSNKMKFNDRLLYANWATPKISSPNSSQSV
jgi:ATP-dependent DNA helicase RecG